MTSYSKLQDLGQKLGCQCLLAGIKAYSGRSQPIGKRWATTEDLTAGIVISVNFRLPDNPDDEILALLFGAAIGQLRERGASYHHGDSENALTTSYSARADDLPQCDDLTQVHGVVDRAST